MFWARTRPTSTRDLLRAEHRLQRPQGRRLLPWAALLLAALLGGWYLSRETAAGQLQRQLAELQARNAGLSAELEQYRLRQSEDQAARQQLLRRIDELSGEIKKLKTDLAFYRQQKPGKSPIPGG